MTNIDNPISLRDLARRLDLSPMVVSSVLRERNNGVRYQAGRVSEIRAAAREHGYRPNNDIGVLLPKPIGEATTIQHEILAGVQAQVQTTQGSNARVITEVIIPDVLPAMIREWQVGGVLLIDAFADSPLITALSERNIPYAVVNPRDEQPWNAIISDESTGIDAVLDHFEKSDCRRVVVALPPIRHRAGPDRRRCFTIGCAARGLELVVIDSADADQVMKELVELSKEPLERTGLFIIAEWWFTAHTVLRLHLDERRSEWVGACLANTPLPWTRLPRTVSVPFTAMGAAAVDLIHRCWALRCERQPSLFLSTCIRP